MTKRELYSELVTAISELEESDIDDITRATSRLINIQNSWEEVIGTTD
jgi:hypothetical protein